MEMKAITLWQPWATLLACGIKEYETRSWATQYRGLMAIHAAACEPKNLRDQMSGVVASILGIENQPEYPRGAVIATADLIACHEMVEDENGNVGFWYGDHGMRKFYAISERQALLGDWKAGRFAWAFANRKMLDTPIPAKGGQRIWNWNGAL